MELKPKDALLACLGGGGLCVVLALVAGSLVALVFSSLLFFFAVAVQRFGDVLLPAFLKKAHVVETRGSWRLLDEVAVLPDGDRFLSSAFLEVDVSHCPSSASPEKTASYAASFEQALSALTFPAQFSVLVFGLDVEKYRESVLTKRLESELLLSRLKKSPKPDVSAVAREERKLSMFSGLLDKLAQGQKPLDVVYFVSTTASGFSEAQAAERVRLQARELKAVVANALNAPVRLLRGDEVKRCLDWKAAIPVSHESFLGRVS
ncbi:hypothetical protein HY572_05710 [Candidatus Micrarchaeota archaeon]|nr:hypothetical protein [Candidatus Micrarchaeota archaeon]